MHIEKVGQLNISIDASIVDLRESLNEACCCVQQVYRFIVLYLHIYIYI